MARAVPWLHAMRGLPAHSACGRDAESQTQTNAEAALDRMRRRRWRRGRPAQEAQPQAQQAQAQAQAQQQSQQQQQQPAVQIGGAMIATSSDVGGWGGSCTCPDGTEHFAGDNRDDCGSLACIGGTAGECHREFDGRWRNKRVTCGAAAEAEEVPLPLPALEGQGEEPTLQWAEPLPLPDVGGAEASPSTLEGEAPLSIVVVMGQVSLTLTRNP